MTSRRWPALVARWRSDRLFSRVAEGRAVVERLAGSSDPVYGISTGFGALATVSIPPDRRTALQKSLIRSHAAEPDRWSTTKLCGQ